MIITAKRFLDEYRPGDIVPHDRYDAETLAGLERSRLVVISQPTAAPTPVVDLDSMTKAELIEYAAAVAHKHPTRITKQDLIDGLRNGQ